VESISLQDQPRIEPFFAQETMKIHEVKGKNFGKKWNNTYILYGRNSISHLLGCEFQFAGTCAAKT
jgi:hypothetical protein